MHMSAPDLTLVREFKRRAEAALPRRIVSILLYGSRARGDARPDSDWDIAVFIAGAPTPEDRRALSDIGFDLMLEHSRFFSPWRSTSRAALKCRTSSAMS
jgi:predicted nucleotidyltransferase